MNNDFKISIKPIPYLNRVVIATLPVFIVFIFSAIAFSVTRTRSDIHKDSNYYMIGAIISGIVLPFVLVISAQKTRFYITDIERKDNGLQIKAMDRSKIKEFNFTVQKLKSKYNYNPMLRGKKYRLIIKESGIGRITQHEFGQWNRETLEEIYYNLQRI